MMKITFVCFSKGIEIFKAIYVTKNELVFQTECCHFTVAATVSLLQVAHELEARIVRDDELFEDLLDGFR